MFLKHHPTAAAAPAAFTLLFLVTLFLSQPIRAQNSYPASGDALIHGLTVGTGAGAGTTHNTAFGSGALAYNNGGFSNVAIGNSALGSNSSGPWNTAVGVSALYLNTTGAGNTATGFAALNDNVSGSNNTAHGAQALSHSTSGSNNTALGTQALFFTTTGNNNTALGFMALITNTVGTSNVAVGIAALGANSTASNQVAVGDSSLCNDTGGGIWNTALGSKTLYTNNTGQQNVAVGYQVLFSNTTGFLNTATGAEALYHNQAGVNNSAYGGAALYNNTSGEDNTALGALSLDLNSTGSYNTAVGNWSLYENSSGNYNCAIGLETLFGNTGSYNTGIGTFASVSPSTATNATAIGANAMANASNSVMIGSSSVTSIGGYANWTNFSDGRYKKNIARNVPGLTFINLLVPITYTLDINGIETKLHSGQKTSPGPDGRTPANPLQDPAVKQAMNEKSQIVYTGFVAQDVDKAAQSVGYKFSGVDKPKNDQESFYGLRYADFVVPLVKAVQELSTANDSLKAANAQLGARLDQIEQVLGIQSNAQNSSVLSLSSARLFQNVPNPFSQSTLINYYLPQNSASALLQITGINGATIKSFAISGTGNGQVTLQTAQLAAGTYTYSLIVDGNLIDTKKMILAK